MALVGCAQVKTEGDFTSVRQQVSDRTGATQVFDPAEEGLVQSKVNELLADGLNIEKCIQLSLLNNPDIQAIFDQIGASRADVVQSQLLTNPGFSITMIWPEGGGRPKVPMNMGQELSDLWQIPIKKKIAQAQLEQVMLAAVHRAVDIATETRIACYKVLALEQADDLARDNEKFIEQSHSVLIERSKAPGASPDDVNRVRALLLDARLMHLNIHRDLRLAQVSLGKLLGLSRATQPWKIVDRFPDHPRVSAAELDLIAYALTERLDAQALAKQVEAADNQYIRQCLSVFPRVVMGPAFELKDTRGVPERNILGDTERASVAKGKLTAPTIQSKNQRDFAKSQIIDTLTGGTLQITIPIWDQNQAQIAKARFVADQRRRDYEALLNTVAVDVQQSFAVMDTASQLVDLYEKDILLQADANVSAAQQAYERGKQSITALIEAKKFFINQRQAYIAARREGAIANANLQRAVGGRFPPPATSQPAAPSNTLGEVP